MCSSMQRREAFVLTKEARPFKTGVLQVGQQVFSQRGRASLEEASLGNRGRGPQIRYSPQHGTIQNSKWRLNQPLQWVGRFEWTIAMGWRISTSHWMGYRCGLANAMTQSS